MELCLGVAAPYLAVVDVDAEALGELAYGAAAARRLFGKALREVAFRLDGFCYRDEYRVVDYRDYEQSDEEGRKRRADSLPERELEDVKAHVVSEQRVEYPEVRIVDELEHLKPELRDYAYREQYPEEHRKSDSREGY